MKHYRAKPSRACKLYIQPLALVQHGVVQTLDYKYRHLEYSSSHKNAHVQLHDITKYAA